MGIEDAARDARGKKGRLLRKGEEEGGGGRVERVDRAATSYW